MAFVAASCTTPTEKVRYNGWASRVPGQEETFVVWKRIDSSKTSRPLLWSAAQEETVYRTWLHYGDDGQHPDDKIIAGEFRHKGPLWKRVLWPYDD